MSGLLLLNKSRRGHAFVSSIASSFQNRLEQPRPRSTHCRYDYLDSIIFTAKNHTALPGYYNFNETLASIFPSNTTTAGTKEQTLQQDLLLVPSSDNFTLQTFDLDVNELSSKVSYFYLLHELGLSQDIMWKIMHDAPSVLGMTAVNIKQKVQVLQFVMDLSLDEIKRTIERQPSLLQLSALENLAPTMDWFLDSLVLDRNELRQLILAQPCLLTLSESNLEQKLGFFTSKRGLGFSVDECRKLLLKEPRLWTSGIKNGLLPRVRFLLHEIGIPRTILRVVVQKNPRILLYSLQQNLVPKLVNYCIMTLQMGPTKDVVKLLATYPQILDYNLDRHILPITTYFINDLDYSVHEFRVILLKFPRLMTYSIEKIKYVVGYLRYELGLNADGVKRVLYQAPQVLGLDMEGNVAPKIKYLQNALFKVDLAEGGGEIDGYDIEAQRQVVREIIVGMPTILNLSLKKNLQLKLDYLQNMLEGNTPGRKNGILRETLLLAPALLGYSLDKRIQPRMEQIVNIGLPPSSITVGITFAEEKYQQWLQRHVDKKAKQGFAPAVNDSTVEGPNENKKMRGASRDQVLSDRSARVVSWDRERKLPIK